MKALLVVANPSLESFSHALVEVGRSTLLTRGYDVNFHDLYAERFNPVQPTGELDNVISLDPLVEQHCAELKQADLVLVSHPNWWGQPPAILKGWIDRVFRLGTAYGYPLGARPEGEPVGLLKVRAAVVRNTSNTPAEREAVVFGDPLDAVWKQCVFGLCGVSRVERRMFGPVSGSTTEQRGVWLAEAQGMVERVA